MQTRQNAKWLTVELMQDGHQVSLLSGELTVDQRASVIQRFRDGKEKVLVTTNVCARGVYVYALKVKLLRYRLHVTKFSLFKIRFREF